MCLDMIGLNLMIEEQKNFRVRELNRLNFPFFFFFFFFPLKFPLRNSGCVAKKKKKKTRWKKAAIERDENCLGKQQEAKVLIR